MNSVLQTATNILLNQTVPPPYQPDLPFGVPADGYSPWQEQLREQLRLLEQRFGVPLSAKAQLQLRDFDRPFTGIIDLVPGTERNPRFRLRGERFDFTLEEIESCERVEPPQPPPTTAP